MSIRAVNRLALPALLALLLIAGRSASSTRRVLAQAPGKTVTYPAGWNLLALPLGTNIISDEGQPVAGPPAATEVSSSGRSTVGIAERRWRGFGRWWTSTSASCCSNGCRRRPSVVSASIERPDIERC